MSRFKNAFRKALRNERGITGLETAIILIAFVVVATVFAFVVLTTGIFSAERGKETVFAGLQKARGTMEVRGGVVVQATAGVPDSIQFQVSTSAGGDAVPLVYCDPLVLTNNNCTVIAYRSSGVVNNSMVYAVDWVVGDGDDLLEPGELATITISEAVGPPAVNTGTIALLGANDRWTLEIQTPVGAVIDLTRSMPAAIDAVVQLH